MKHSLKPYAIFILASLTISFTSCMDKEQFKTNIPDSEEKEYNKNDFHTTAEVTLNISYNNLSEIQANVPFEVYDKMPLDDELYTKLENVEPIYAGLTDASGNYSQKIVLPSYATKLYIYSSAFYAPALLTADITNGIATAELKTNNEKSRSAMSRATGSYTTSVLSQNGWKQWLGEFNPANGSIIGYSDIISGVSYETKRVSKDTYTLSGKWLEKTKRYFYYYYHPQTNEIIEVSKFYNYSGNRSSSSPSFYYQYYDRIVEVPTEEKNFHSGYAYIYEEGSGKPDLSIDNYQDLYIQHSKIFNESGVCDEAYRSSKDLYVNESAEIAVTMLGGRTCWNSSMGYYYYKEGNKPASLDKANIILLFPNTQDGTWNNNAGMSFKGVEHGTAVQLYYYPNIDSNSKEGATTIFPAGYRIGFVLATNTWGNKLMTGNNVCFAATSEGLSIKNGKQVSEPRTAVYSNGDKIVFSFEDHTNDQNFSDVVFTMKSNPIDAITEVPDINEDITMPTTVKGVYAFEDMWPKKGDYDLNDVIVSSRYGKTVNANYILSETFIFKTFSNYATLKSGLGVVLKNVNLTDAEVTLNIGGKEIAVEGKGKDGNIFLLADNVKDYMGKDYKLTVKYYNPAIKSSEGTANVFIWREGNNNNKWEVHIPQEAPTELADMSFFKTEDDLSIIDSNLFYVRSGNYPFAIFLSGATQDDVSKLLDSKNESKSIDVVYPKYKTWVEGGFNSIDAGWYK